LKNKATEKFEEFHTTFGQSDIPIPVVLDDTLPVYFPEVGSLHPLTIIRDEITQIFQRLGFGLEEGPEIEDDWHNFSRLEFSSVIDPARDMQDTFFIDADSSYALRTHTSSVQVRLLEKREPPVRCIMPGRVYRNEAVSARANCFFHQIEGIYNR
jgi:phenylalanyl-tRNA synthetase alpha chain